MASKTRLLRRAKADLSDRPSPSDMATAAFVHALARQMESMMDHGKRAHEVCPPISELLRAL